MDADLTRPCSSTSVGSDEVEDNYGDEDEDTKLEFEQFKQWLDAGSPASKIPRTNGPAPGELRPDLPVTTSSAPAMVADVMCSKCGHKECNLTFSNNLWWLVFSEGWFNKMMNPLFGHNWMTPSNLYWTHKTKDCPRQSLSVCYSPLWVWSFPRRSQVCAPTWSNWRQGSLRRRNFLKLLRKKSAYLKWDQTWVGLENIHSSWKGRFLDGPTQLNTIKPLIKKNHHIIRNTIDIWTKVWFEHLMNVQSKQC